MQAARNGVGIHSCDIRADSGPTCRCRANVINVANGVNVIKLDNTSIVMVGGVKVSPYYWYSLSRHLNSQFFLLFLFLCYIIILSVLSG